MVSGLHLILSEQLKCCLMVKMKIILVEVKQVCVNQSSIKLSPPRLSVGDIDRQRTGQSGGQVVPTDKLSDTRKETLFKH